MADHDDLPTDELLRSAFDRVVELADVATPPVAELEGRVVGLADRQARAQRRTALGAAAAVLVVVGIVAALLGTSSRADRDGGVATAPTSTSAPIEEVGEPVFTIGAVPASLAFTACTGGLDSDPPTVSCTYDDPATPQVDGLRVTRVIGGATPEARAAWESGDAAAAAAATGGSDSIAAARFVELGEDRVLDIAPAGQPSGEAVTALRMLVGEDLVDLGATGVSPDELDEVVAGIGLEAPIPVLRRALEALPEGSTALVQGPRPLWSQPDALRPEEAVAWEGETAGAEIAVAGTDQVLGVELTTGIDAGALLDELLATEELRRSEAELGGHRALVLGPEGTLPRSVPEPRWGPQALVALDDATLLRVSAPQGTADQVVGLADAFS